MFPIATCTLSLFFQVYDLLNPHSLNPSELDFGIANPKRKALHVREDKKVGVFVAGLKRVKVLDEAGLLAAMGTGLRECSVQATKMNAVSSRSHTIFELSLVQTVVVPSSEEQQGVAGKGGPPASALPPSSSAISGGSGGLPGSPAATAATSPTAKATPVKSPRGVRSPQSSPRSATKAAKGNSSALSSPAAAATPQSDGKKKGAGAGAAATGALGLLSTVPDSGVQLRSKLSLIDLAGSERAGQQGLKSKGRLTEGNSM